jgi:YfiH family protein
VIELALPGARVLFTTRAEGDVRENDGRARVRAHVGLPLAVGRQVHGAIVRRVTEPAPDPEQEGDGQATALPDLAPAVLVADCLPVALAGDGVVAMLHGGWRGLAAGIVEEGVRAVRELGAEERLAVAIGPGARACCYEVGDDVRAAFGTTERTLDLAAIAVDRLQAAGVGEVWDTGVCTICDERFFSHRRQGVAAGRQAGVVWRA